MKAIKSLFIDARGRRHHLQSDTGLTWDKCLDDDSALGQAISGLPTVPTPCATGEGWSDPETLAKIGWPTWITNASPTRLVVIERLPEEILLFILKHDNGITQWRSRSAILNRANVPDVVVDYIIDHNPDLYHAAMVHRRLHDGDSILPNLSALPGIDQTCILEHLDLSQALESDLDIIITRQPITKAPDHSLADDTDAPVLRNPTLPIGLLEKHWRNLSSEALSSALANPRIPKHILVEASEYCSTNSLHAIIDNPQTDFDLLTKLTLHESKRIGNKAREELMSRMSAPEIE